MPHSGSNIRIEILVNGVRKSIAGVESFGVLTALLSWVRRDAALLPTGEGAPRLDEWIENRVSLSIGGMDSTAHRALAWLNLGLAAGDQVTLRVLPPGEFDTPGESIGRCDVGRDEL